MRHKNSISNSLRKYRKLKGLSQEELADILQLSIKEYNLIECGDRPMPYKTIQILFREVEMSELELSND